jgi:cytochrome P450
MCLLHVFNCSFLISVLPPGTGAQIPAYCRVFIPRSIGRMTNRFIVVHRDPRYFSPDPLEFWPERWTKDGPKLAEARGKEFRLSQAAYIPFSFGTCPSHDFHTPFSSEECISTSSGPANCAGRSLALHEMRTVLATIIRRFDIEYAPSFTARDWEDQLTDRFVFMRGPLLVILRQRAH